MQILTIAKVSSSQYYNRLYLELNLICNEKNQQGEQVEYLSVLVALLLIFKKTNNILFKKYYGKEKLREN